MEVRPLASDAGAQPGGLNPADRSGPQLRLRARKGRHGHARRTAPEREAGAGARTRDVATARYEAGLLASGWTARP
jgi:hypothetical protein